MRTSRVESLTLGIAGMATCIVAWELVTRFGLTSRLFLPPPGSVVTAFSSYVKSPTFAGDVSTSSAEFGLGLGIAIAVGIPMGIAMGWYPRVRYAFDPFVTFLYSIPRFALAPLMVIWLGLGIWSKVGIVFLGAVFALVITLMEGVRDLDAEMVQCAKSFGATRNQILFTVGIPAAVPYILSGLRLGIARALVGVVVGELVAAQRGLGLEMEVAGTTYQTSKVFAIIAIFAAAALVLNFGVQAIERHFRGWALASEEAGR
jgi:NitT/TauT family transport system permease protein